MAGTKRKVSSWIGVLAQLRRVDIAHLGRLVLVERAVPAQVITRAGPEPAPVWHVFVLGARLNLLGDMWREVEVAEPCLQPLCRLPAAIAEAATVTQAELDADEAIAELRDYLAANPMRECDLDASIERAAQTAFGARRWPMVPVRPG